MDQVIGHILMEHRIYGRVVESLNVTMFSVERDCLIFLHFLSMNATPSTAAGSFAPFWLFSAIFKIKLVRRHEKRRLRTGKVD